MQTKIRRKKMTLNLNTLKVETLAMPATAPIRAVTTSQTCPTLCDTDFDCSNGCNQVTMDRNCTRYC